MSEESMVLVDLEAERAVLGSILLDPPTIISVIDRLQAKDFYNEEHQAIYAAMQELHAAGSLIDTVTLYDQAQKKGTVLPTSLFDLVAHIPTAAYIEHYAIIVAEHAARRAIVAAASAMVKLAYQPANASAAIIIKAQQLLEEINARQRHESMLHISDIMTTVIENANVRSNTTMAAGIPTGFTMIDLITGGLQRQDSIIIAARPGMGKTTLATNMATAAAKQTGQVVAIFSMEMSNEQVATRMLAGETKIDSTRIRAGNMDSEEWTTLLSAAERLQKTGIWIDDGTAFGVADIRSRCLRLKAQYGELALVVIDYIQLMASEGRAENRQQEISAISRRLKQLARELNAPVLTLSQLSRKVEERADKHPLLSDLRESGSIEQDADLVMFIYREDYYLEDSERQNITEVTIAKHRNGAQGKVDLYFNRETNTFHSLQIERKELQP